MVLELLARRWGRVGVMALALAVSAWSAYRAIGQEQAIPRADPSPPSTAQPSPYHGTALAQPAKTWAETLPTPPSSEAAPMDISAPLDTQIPPATPLPQPSILQRPLESPAEKPLELLPDNSLYFSTPVDAPLGFTGRSSVLPQAIQSDPHFVPLPDRWRIGFPEWDRYDKGHPPVDDYPYKPGNWWDPFNENVLKGDYPIIGQNTFFIFTASLRGLLDTRQTPIATTPFESTVNPNSQEFFGSPDQLAPFGFLALSFDLFHGDAAFRPMDWRIKLTPVFNINSLSVEELAVTNPDVLRGTTRPRTFIALEEWFLETKLADLSPDYDFLSLRLGAQPFTSDFRGFIFSDINRGARLFGTRLSNREQFNLVYFRQLEKDTNSGLNSFNERDQGVLIANYFRQDFIWPGYTFQMSVHYNRDEPSFKFDKNDVLVRPDPVGVFQEHGLDVVYLGWAGDGHINRFNVSHAAYWALGRDSLNPLANRGQDISAAMAACELSYDRDWARFRTSFFWASGDDDINNGHATGFDAIFDNPNFAGGDFSFWQRQAIRLFGVNLVNRESLLPNLRSSKIQGQSNFVNPGLYLCNFGLDMDLTPKFRVVNNLNFLWFDSLNPLRQFVFQERINHYIGADLSMGIEWRPWLSNNFIVKAGISGLIPGRGFKDLFNELDDNANPLIAGFLELVLTY